MDEMMTWAELYRTYGKEVYRLARLSAGSDAATIELLRRVRLRVDRLKGEPRDWLRRTIMKEAEKIERNPGGLPASLDKVLGEMSTNERHAWLIKEIEGLSLQDTAAMFGVSANAIKMRVKRAQEKLQGEVAKHLTGQIDGAREMEPLPLAALEPDVIPIQAHPKWRRLVPLAGVGVAILSVLVFVRPADANRSELRVERPGMEDIFAVSYRPDGRLAGEQEVILRARFRTANDLQPDPMVRPQMVAVLTKQGREFRGAFRLPDSVVFAAFAVESKDARIVDTNNGRLWDWRENSYPAIVQLRHDLMGRNTARAYEVAQEAVGRYPTHPDAWRSQAMLERLFTGSIEFDRYAGMLDRLALTPGVGVAYPGDLYDFALSVLNDSRRAAYWRTALQAIDPMHPYLIRDRTIALGDSSLTANEHWWNETGGSRQLAQQGFNKARDAAELIRWGNRYADHRPGIRVYVGKELVRRPETRDHGIEMLQAELNDQSRRLHETFDEYEGRKTHAAGPIFAAIGRAVVESGNATDAVLYFDRAVDTGWNPEVSLIVGEYWLQRGDTASARRHLARAMVDPTFADSTYLTFFAEADLESARERMVRATLRDTRPRPLPNIPGLREALSGVTVLVKWSRNSPDAFGLLDRLLRVRALVQEYDAELILLTDGDRPNTSLPIIVDADATFDRELGIAASYYFAVVDARGRVQFTHDRIDRLVRQVVALSQEQPIVAD